MGGLVARWFIHEYADRWKAMWNKRGAERHGRVAGCCSWACPIRARFSSPRSSPARPRSSAAWIGSISAECRRARPDLPLLREPLPAPAEAGDGAVPRSTSPKPIAEANLRKARTAAVTWRSAGPTRSPGACSTTRSSSKQGWRVRSTPGAPSPSPDTASRPSWAITTDQFAPGRSVSGLGGWRRRDCPPELARPDDEGVREYFIREDHAALISNPKILSSLTKLLAEGRTDALPDNLPVMPGQPVATKAEATSRRASGAGL